MFARITVALALLGTCAVWAKETGTAPPAPTLRIVQMSEGLRKSVAPRGDLTRLPETAEYKAAAGVGLNLFAPNHDILAHRFTGETLFYIFFKTVDDAYGPNQYVIQRIKKTVRDWPDAAGEPTETVTYLVEVFKPFAGRLKSPDCHYGSFSLRDNARREIVKEYEIGYGEIPGVAEGTQWPFEQRKLFKKLYHYGPDRTLYDKVKFTAVRKWGLYVALAKSGRYAVRSDELGFDAPTTLPTVQAGTPAVDPSTKDLVLAEGRGVGRVTLGGDPGAIAAEFGAPLFVVKYPSGTQAHRTAAQLTVKLNKAGKISHLYTHSGFAGRTSKGIGQGAHKGEVIATYGRLPRGDAASSSWRYPGVQFDFDSFERVRRIVITK